MSLGDKRLGFRTNKLLLQNDDARAVRLLVFELGDLISDLLLACG